jgi:hypothetical protein
MNALRKMFLLLTAGGLAAGSVQAQDKSAQVQPVLTTNAVPALVLEKTPAPHFDLGFRTLVSGLVVDFIEPQQSWDVLNPALSAPALPKPDVLMPPPVVAPPPISGPEHHEPNFAILRISFP